MRHTSIAVLTAAAVGLAGCTAASGTTADPPRAATTGQVPAGLGAAGDSAQPPTPAPPDLTAHLTIAGSGDLLTHARVRQSAERYAGAAGRYDFSPMFAKVAPVLKRADLAICHMETPLTSTNTRLTQPGILVFNTPHELADAVRSAGWAGCDFASNHTWDQGLAGLADTIKVFAAAKVAYAGAGASAKQPQLIARYAAGGLQVAQLGYSYTVYNDWGPNTTLPPDAPWLGQSLWPATGAEGILRDAKQAKADGADVVVVSLHWGDQYVTEPNADQVALAKKLLASPDVDVILGTHVHVVQPCEKINGKFVFYGLGNFLSNQSPLVDASLRPETQEGMIAQITLARDAAGKVTQSASYLPTKVNLDGHVVEPATKQSNPETFERVTTTLTARGCALTPITP